MSISQSLSDVLTLLLTDRTHLSETCYLYTLVALCNIQSEIYLGNRGLAKIGLHDGNARLLIGQRNVDKLVQTAGTKDCRVDDVWPNTVTDTF